MYIFGFAETTPDSGDPRLRDRIYTASPDQIAAAVAGAVARFKRWRFIGYDRATGTIHLEHDTPIIHFTDDIVLRLRKEGNVTRVTGQSKARIGKFDYGVNARNLRAILGEIDRTNFSSIPPIVRRQTATQKS